MSMMKCTRSVGCAAAVVVGYLWCSPLTQVGRTEISAVGLTRQRGDQDPRSKLYYGVSRFESQTLAWLLWFDATHFSGSLYAPPGTEGLRDIRVSHAGRVTFSANHLSGVIYDFEGVLGAKELSGEMKVRPLVGPVIHQTMELRQHRVPELNTLDWQRSGLYSNAALNDLSGDLNGIEIAIVLSEAPVGAYVQFGDTFFPQPLIKLTKTKDGIAFGLQTRGTLHKYEGRYRGRTLILREAERPNSRIVVLEGRKTVEEAFNVSVQDPK